MAGIVWLVKKIRHLIEASANTAIVYTDCAAAVGLVLQISLNTSSAVKLSLRLGYQSYLQQFQMENQHKLGRTNFVPSSVARPASREYGLQTDEVQLGAFTVDVFAVRLIQVGNAFKQRVK